MKNLLCLKKSMAILLTASATIGSAFAGAPKLFTLKFDDQSSIKIIKVGNKRHIKLCENPNSNECDYIAGLKMEQEVIDKVVEDEKESEGNLKYFLGGFGGLVGAGVGSTKMVTAATSGAGSGLILGLVLGGSSGAILDFLIDNDKLSGEDVQLMEEYLLKSYIIDNTEGVLDSAGPSGIQYAEKLKEAVELYNLRPELKS